MQKNELIAQLELRLAAAINGAGGPSSGGPFA